MSMSFRSTSATRDELAEREVEEFDPNYSYVFGSVARYKADNCNGQYGTVIASYNIEHGGEVAGVVFVSVDSPLYVIPASFFRPGRELQLLFTSNSQRRRREENFALMDCVQLGHDENHRVLWVTKASRHHSRLDLFSDGDIGTDTTGVIRPGTKMEEGGHEPRRLWTEKLGWFNDIPQTILNKYLANVAYQVRFRLITDVCDEDELQPETLQMANFYPTFQFQLYEFLAVDDVHQAIVETTEWNAPGVENRVDYQDSDEQWAFGLEKDKPKSERSQAIKNVLCVTISDTELYAARFESDPTVMVRVPRIGYWKLEPGTYVEVTLVYNKWHNWYIVLDHSEEVPYKPLPYKTLQIDYEMEQVMLLLEVEVIELEHFYFHPFCGLVLDRQCLLNRDMMCVGDKCWVWAVHEQGAGSEECPSNFVFHSIPTPDELMSDDPMLD